METVVARGLSSPTPPQKIRSGAGEDGQRVIEESAHPIEGDGCKRMAQTTLELVVDISLPKAEWFQITATGILQRLGMKRSGESWVDSRVFSSMN